MVKQTQTIRRQLLILLWGFFNVPLWVLYGYEGFCNISIKDAASKLSYLLGGLCFQILT